MKRPIFTYVCLLCVLLIAGFFVPNAAAITRDNVVVTWSNELSQSVEHSDKYDIQYIVDHNLSQDNYYRVVGHRSDAAWHDSKGSVKAIVTFTFLTSDLVTEPFVSNLRMFFSIKVTPHTTDKDIPATACYSYSIKGELNNSTTYWFTQPCVNDSATQSDFTYTITDTKPINASMDKLTVEIYGYGEAQGNKNSDPYVDVEIKIFELDPIDNSGPAVQLVPPPSDVGAGQDYVAKAYIQDPVNGLAQIQLFCQDKKTLIPCWASIPAFVPGTTDEILVEGRIQRGDQPIAKEDVSIGLIVTDELGYKTCYFDWKAGCSTGGQSGGSGGTGKYFLFLPVLSQ